MRSPSQPEPPREAITPAQRQMARRMYLVHSADLLAFFRSARKMTRADAMDLLQQTFSALLRTLARHEHLRIEHPRAFVFKIAVRQLQATIRRQRCRPVLDGEIDPSDLVARDDQENEASLRSEQRLILRGIRRLSDDAHRREPAERGTVSHLQLLVYLRFWVGLTLAEVAEILEISPAAVSGRQRRALHKLQRCIVEIEQEAGISPSTSTTVLVRWRDMLAREVHGRQGSPDADDDAERLGAHDDTMA